MMTEIAAIVSACGLFEVAQCCGTPSNAVASLSIDSPQSMRCDEGAPVNTVILMMLVRTICSMESVLKIEIVVRKQLGISTVYPAFDALDELTAIY
jgi:hypothetical protein